MARTATALVTELDTLYGLDLEDSEALALLNEASRELAGRSEWFQATVDLGPTVADQAEYSIPSDVHSIRTLKVNDIPWQPSNETLADQVESGTHYLQRATGAGIFFITYGSTNVEKVELYPVPDTAGYTILARVVEYPPTLVASSPSAGQSTTTSFPDEFDRALLHYSAAHCLGGSEDNLESMQFHMDKFDERALELTRLRITRSGRGPRQIKIAGVHA